MSDAKALRFVVKLIGTVERSLMAADLDHLAWELGQVREQLRQVQQRVAQHEAQHEAVTS